MQRNIVVAHVRHTMDRCVTHVRLEATSGLNVSAKSEILRRDTDDTKA